MECFLLEKKGRCSMSVEDRDWYREDFKRKEEEYGGDFSLGSRPVCKQPQRYRERLSNKQLDLQNAIICPILCYFGLRLASGLVADKLQLGGVISVILAIYSIWCFVTAIHRNEKENDKTVVNVIALLSGAGCTIVTVVIAFMMMSSLIR